MALSTPNLQAFQLLSLTQLGLVVMMVVMILVVIMMVVVVMMMMMMMKTTTASDTSKCSRFARDYITLDAPSPYTNNNRKASITVFAFQRKALGLRKLE